MEPATALQSVPFRKKLRAGQQRVISALTAGRNHLNIKLPTGYGKTYLAACVYSTLQKRGKVNRLLYIVSNDAQLNQFYKDARDELGQACVDGPLKIIDVSYSVAGGLREHRQGTSQIYVITIQSLCEQRGSNNVAALLETGQWMVCIDEYHHYGIGKAWGRTALALNRAFLLCMSATPSRPDDDSAFGVPDVSVTYREAVDEKAVKPLMGFSYNYRIDFDKDGETIHCTTKDLFEQVGSEAPDQIERFTIKRKMRWSPDYISPLICVPIDRMHKTRIASGYKLQALIFAMCVSHAKVVCEQIQAAYPELAVDWIGTGDYGRPTEINREILNRFCPPIGADGKRPTAEIDVLVNVGMAGEGLNTIKVSEEVFLSNASLNNRNIQSCGRASRYLDVVIGNINFDASSEFAEAGYIGSKIMDAMDFAQPRDGDDDNQEPQQDGDGDYEALPDEPFIHVYHMELIEIDSGDEGLQLVARMLETHDPKAFDYEAMKRDVNHPHWSDFKTLLRIYRAKEAADFDEKAIVEQWRDSVSSATRQVVRLALRKAGVAPFRQKELSGNAWREINRCKQRLFGSIDGINDVPLLKQHWGWVKQLERDMLNDGVPQWLQNILSE